METGLYKNKNPQQRAVPSLPKRNGNRISYLNPSENITFPAYLRGMETYDIDPVFLQNFRVPSLPKRNGN